MRLTLEDSQLDPPSRHQPLTPREREVVTLLADGYTGEEVAQGLGLTPNTVRTHVRNAMSRTGAKTRAHLIALAIVNGEIELD